MSRCSSRLWLFRCVAVSFAILFAILFGFTALPALAQGARGTVTITVLDPSGAVVPKATLKLLDLETSTVRKATTSRVGTYSFVALPLGTYRLTVSKSGFKSQVNNSVIVQAGQTTDVSVALKVGTSTQKVTVSAAAVPLLKTTSNGIKTTINMKQLKDLPLSGRNVATLAFLTPGYSATAGTAGTWNGLPAIAQGNSIDGVVSSSTRMKFAGAAEPGPSARLDAISQMTVSTSQMNVSQGYGLSAMTVNFTTKRGTNNFHGRVYEDFRNSYLNANSWTNNAVGLPRNHFILNDFGGDLGGPILHNKLFFFGALGIAKQPGGYNHTATVLRPLAQQGIFTETNGKQVNLFSQVAGPNGLPAMVNPVVAAEQAKINKSLSYGRLSPVAGDPNLETLNWFVNAPQTTYFPTGRIDYNISPKLRMDLAFNETKHTQPGANAPFFPGPAFANTGGEIKSNDYTASLGIDWAISPTLINQFRGGYYYNAFWDGYGASTAYTTGVPIVNWAYGTSGQSYTLPTTQYYPVVNFSDNMTWQTGSHMLTYGVSYWREQDHYWNPPDGIYTYDLGLANGDPALTDFNKYFANTSSTNRGRAEALYATLAGRVSFVGPNGSGFPYNVNTGMYYKTPGHAFNLDSLQSTWNLYLHDSWRLKPSFTLNYGLRWGFYNANHDLTGVYHNANVANVYGPTAVGQLFEPGVLRGVQNPALVANSRPYPNYYITPQPQIGFAWNPRHLYGWLNKLTGNGNTVVRAGFNLTRFTEPQQYFWDVASNYGFAFFQRFSLTASTSGGTGTFQPGSLALNNNQITGHPNLPPFFYNIKQYQRSFPQSGQTWFGAGVNGFNSNIKQPYLEQWNFGIQRQFGHDNVLSITYLGHHALHEWIAVNPNEANIFQPAMQIKGVNVPGFLSEFESAQHNMAINAANGMGSTFAYNGLPGQQPLPIFSAAFAGEPVNSAGAPEDFSNGTYLNYLTEGNVGAMAGTLDTIFGNAPYYCNLVGASFGPCANLIGYTGAGAGYPINYFQANPYESGRTTGVMTDGGFGNYNALEIDFRQHNWHGMEFDANYTWSHALGVAPNYNFQGGVGEYTIRNLRLNYGPSLFDVRQVLHVSGTYDLPFGHGEPFLNTGNPLVNRIVGGWTLGTIITYQTGKPILLGGGYNTFNATADGGVNYNGVTASELQSAVGVHELPGQTVAAGLSPNLFQGTGTQVDGPNGTTLTPNTTPGTFGNHIYIYGPHFSNTDIAVTKTTPIREGMQFILQAELLNAFNHPNWTLYDGGVQDPSFGYAYVSNTTAEGFGREIQLRASITF